MIRELCCLAAGSLRSIPGPGGTGPGAGTRLSVTTGSGGGSSTPGCPGYPSKARPGASCCGSGDGRVALSAPCGWAAVRAAVGRPLQQIVGAYIGVPWRGCPDRRATRTSLAHHRIRARRCTAGDVPAGTSAPLGIGHPVAARPPSAGCTPPCAPPPPPHGRRGWSRTTPPPTSSCRTSAPPRCGVGNRRARHLPRPRRRPPPGRTPRGDGLHGLRRGEACALRWATSTSSGGTSSSARSASRSAATSWRASPRPARGKTAASTSDSAPSAP
jgi:hypothetical protein